MKSLFKKQLFKLKRMITSIIMIFSTNRTLLSSSNKVYTLLIKMWSKLSLLKKK